MTLPTVRFPYNLSRRRRALARRQTGTVDHDVSRIERDVFLGQRQAKVWTLGESRTTDENTQTAANTAL